jgi:hypothetical protein
MGSANYDFDNINFYCTANGMKISAEPVESDAESGGKFHVDKRVW